MSEYITTTTNRDTSKIFDKARRFVGTDYQKRLTDAYALIGEQAPRIDRTAELLTIGAAMIEEDGAAFRLAEAALDPAADLEALVVDALNERAASLAWKSLATELSSSGRKTAERKYRSEASTAFRKLAPFVKKLLADLKRSARKLDAVADVFDAVAVVEAEADTAALAELKRSLATLGIVARLEPGNVEGFRGLLRFVDVPAGVVDYGAPEAKAVRNLARQHPRTIDYDRVIVDVARGRMAGLTLSYASTEEELAAREARLDAIMAIPAPPVNHFGGKAERQERRRLAVGPSSH